jgi:hypothetical protein
MSTETTVPLMGLFSVASLSDCSALMRSASAESMAAWSDAICSGVSVLPPEEPVPVGVEPDPVEPEPDAPLPVLPVKSACSRACTPWVGVEPGVVVEVPPPEDSAVSA